MKERLKDSVAIAMAITFTSFLRKCFVRRATIKVKIRLWIRCGVAMTGTRLVRNAIVSVKPFG